MGNVTTQFIHIDDLARIFESVVHTDKTIGQACNVTHPRIVGWQQLLNIAMDVVKKEVKVVQIDSQNAQVHERQYFPFRNVTYMLDIKKLERDGLHVPQIDLEDGLTRTYKWYRGVKPLVQDVRMDKMDEVLRGV
ncbi:NAD-dependent epimerase/dehydratase family protein [Alkaliphilus hydrothermalis]|nr:hypothetical protein [Alkaliphilus hydrothermalis]